MRNRNKYSGAEIGNIESIENGPYPRMTLDSAFEALQEILIDADSWVTSEDEYFSDLESERADWSF